MMTSREARASASNFIRAADAVAPGDRAGGRSDGAAWAEAFKSGLKSQIRERTSRSRRTRRLGLPSGGFAGSCGCPGGGTGQEGYLAWRRLRLAQSSSAPKATSAPPTRTVGAELVPVKGSCPPAVVVVAPPTAEVVEVAPATVLVVVTPAGQGGSGSGCECLVRLFSVGSVQCARAMISSVEPSSVGASIRT